MNESQITDVLTAIEEHNRSELGLIAKAALMEELPDLEFGEVITRLVQKAKTQRFLNPSDVLGVEQPTTAASKFAAADAAWSNISQLASQSDGMMGLIANIDSVKWEDDTARQALLETRQAIKTKPEKSVLWEFRETYNRLHEASGQPEQVTAQLPTGYEPPKLRAAPTREGQPLDVHQLVTDMKIRLATAPTVGE